MVDVTLSWNADRASIEIRDYGSGLNLDQADQLGQAFVTDKADGLGSGSVSISGHINPIWRFSEPTKCGQLRPRYFDPYPFTSGKSFGMNYLLVDDDAVFSAVLARMLVRRGDQAVTASNGTQASELCDQTIDRVVLDLKLEQESGLSILQQLRDIQPNIDVVILTGYSSISTAVEAIKLGAINYLCKPASVDEIIAAFENTDGEVALEQSPPSVNRLEWEHIQRVLNENDGNISATARSLGMHRRTLQRKLQKRPVKN